MIKKLWVQGFRNLQETVIDFGSAKQVVIFGENNQGKTNFLEAVHLVINGQSPLEDKLENLVTLGQVQALLGIDFVTESGDRRLYCKVSAQRKKWGVLDGKNLKSYLPVRALIRSEFISSDVIRIFKESPEVRRKDLDRFCSAYFPSYSPLLKKYERVIKQKNAILKLSPSASEVRFWNLELVALAKVLLPLRFEALEKIKGALAYLIQSEAFPFIEERLDTLKLDYLFSWTTESNEMIKALEEKLEGSLSKEINVGYSLYGLHRDDFGIVINHKNLFSFFSRGINRLMAVLLKLAQLQLLEEKEGLFPLLLLDDTFSEIDPKIKKMLIDLLIKNKRSMIYTSVLKEDQFLFKNPWVGVMHGGVLSV